MPRYRDDEYDDEDRRPYRRADRSERPRETAGHSTIGILSFLAALLSGFLLFGLFVMAGVMASNGGLPDDSPEAIATGLGLFAGMGVALLGLILGVVALFQDGNKLFPTLGTILSALVLMGTAALLCAGALAG